MRETPEWTKQEIIPLGKKMREKVRQHGKIWWVRHRPADEYASVNKMLADKTWHLRTLQPVHNGGHPYELWAECGRDFRFAK